ncbi:hypothetical protein [Lysinibacillus sp. NPDC092081]|uniref:hypothetical protein n=1 Tax=Lysinibacillus sp. NPDC092081 TaxID=3364131 RepID=UPI003821E48C
MVEFENPDGGSTTGRAFESVLVQANNDQDYMWIGGLNMVVELLKHINSNNAWSN